MKRIDCIKQMEKEILSYQKTVKAYYDMKLFKRCDYWKGKINALKEAIELLTL